MRTPESAFASKYLLKDRACATLIENFEFGSIIMTEKIIYILNGEKLIHLKTELNDTWIPSLSKPRSTASAKVNKLETYAYLKTVFTKLPQAETLEDIEALLLWKVGLLKS